MVFLGDQPRLHRPLDKTKLAKQAAEAEGSSHAWTTPLETARLADLEDFQGDAYFAGSNFKLTPFMQ